jgi:hypothetical protein
MSQTTTASARFTNRRAAQRAAERLVEGGFARGSIEMRRLHSDDDDHEVSVRVREGNVERAKDLLHARPDVRDFAGKGVNVGPLIAFAGALAVGVAGYTWYTLADRRPGDREENFRRATSRGSA